MDKSHHQSAAPGSKPYGYREKKGADANTVIAGHQGMEKKKWGVDNRVGRCGGGGGGGSGVEGGLRGSGRGRKGDGRDEDRKTEVTWS